MTHHVTGGATDQSFMFKLRKTADGLEATGLTITDLDLQYTRTRTAPTAKVDATALAATDSAHADNKAIELDATDQPGVYRVDWPDAAFAAGAAEVVLTVKHASCFSEDLRVVIDTPVNVTALGGSTTPVTNLGVVYNTDFATNYDTTNDRWTVNVKTWNDLTTVALPLVPTVAGRTLDVSAGGEAGIDWANVGTPGSTVNLSATTVNTITTYTGNTPQTGDSYAIVNSGTHGNAAIKGYVDDIGTAGAGLTAVPWNSAWDAEVQSEVQDAIEVNHLDHFIAVADPGGIVANSSFLAKLVSKSATPAFTSFDNTSDSLEALRDRGDAAWTTATGFSTLDAAGVRTAVGLASANLDTQLDALPTNAELATALGTADDAVLAAIAALSIPTANQIADAVLTRDVSNVEDTAGDHSLCFVVLASGEFSISGTAMTVRKTTGATFATKTLTKTAGDDPVRGVN